MKKLILITVAMLSLTSCALLDPDGISYNPNSFDTYGNSNSSVITYSIAGENHIVFK